MSGSPFCLYLLLEFGLVVESGNELNFGVSFDVPVNACVC